MSATILNFEEEAAKRMGFSSAAPALEALCVDADDEFFEREARKQGFPNYRALEEWVDATQEAEWERQARAAGFKSFDEFVEHQMAQAEGESMSTEGAYP